MIRATSPTTCSRRSSRTRIVDAIVARAADAVESLVSRGPRRGAAALQLTLRCGRAVGHVGCWRVPARCRVPPVTASSVSFDVGTRECPWGWFAECVSVVRDRPEAPRAAGSTQGDDRRRPVRPAACGRHDAGATMTPRDAVPASRMDPDRLRALTGLVDELAASERFRAFARRLPGGRARLRAGASAPPRDAARDARASARLPARRGRGGARRRRGDRLVRRSRDASRSSRAAASALGSGLEPPAHLVGERARALDVLDAGGLVCVSARALAEGMPPRATTDPTSIRFAVGDEPRPRRARRGARARRLRARRARRGARADRGARRPRRRLPEHGARAASGRVLRRRDRADPGVLAVHPARASSRRGGDRSIPARERRRDLVEPEVDPTTSRGGPAPAPRSAARPRLAARRREASVWDEERARASGPRRRRRSSTRSRASQPHVLRGAAPGDRGTRARGGGERARRDGAPGAARRRHVPPPGRGAAHAAPAAQGRGDGRRRGASTLLELRPVAASSSAPRAEASSGATSGSRCFPTRRSSASARRASTRGSARAPVLRRPPRRRLRRPRGSRRRASSSGSRRRRSPASRATTSSSRSGARTASTSRTSRSRRSRRYIGADAKAPSLSKLGGKAWQNLKSRARASVRELAGELLALYAQRQQAPGSRARPHERLARAARELVSRTARPTTSCRRSRRSRRISRRRGRWIGSSAATSASARPRSPCGPPSPSR